MFLSSLLMLQAPERHLDPTTTTIVAKWSLRRQRRRYHVFGRFGRGMLYDTPTVSNHNHNSSRSSHNKHHSKQQPQQQQKLGSRMPLQKVCVAVGGPFHGNVRDALIKTM